MAKIIKKFYTLYKAEEDKNDYFWIKNEGSDGYLYVYISGGWDEPLECSFDKINWFSYNEAYNYDWPAGSKVYLRNTSGVLNSSSNHITFEHGLDSTTPLSIGGDMTTLLNYRMSNKKEILTLPDYCFYALFDSSSLLSVDCNIGNVQTIGSNSFYGTFNSANSLESVTFDMSKVKGIGIGSFLNMFRYCGALTSINIDLSSLETVGSQGMQSMFDRCGALTSINIDLSSLETVETKGMLNMFSFCTSLTKGLDLKSVTTVVGQGMEALYYGCSVLSEATAPNVDDWGDYYYFTSWLYDAGTQATGTKTFNAPTGLDIPTGPSGIPWGWTRVDY